jgi:hypothetical protein
VENERLTRQNPRFIARDIKTFDERLGPEAPITEMPRPSRGSTSLPNRPPGFSDFQKIVRFLYLRKKSFNKTFGSVMMPTFLTSDVARRHKVVLLAGKRAPRRRERN